MSCKKTYGLHIRMWAYFFVMATAIMVMIWCMQIFLLRTFYSRMKSSQITSYGNEIWSAYNSENGIDDEFRDTIYNICHQNGISARIFTEEGTLIYSPEMYMFDKAKVETAPIPAEAVQMQGEPHGVRISKRPQDGFLLKYFEITTELKNGEEYVLKRYRDPYSHEEQILYARELPGLNGEKYYLTINSMLAPIDVTSQVLQTQLVVITITALLIAFLLSYFFAKKLAKPIVNITNSAKRLAKGDFSVKFESSNYTEINDLSTVLNNTTAELAKTDTLRRDLIANVSHDLRTPMTIIKSYAEMIRDLSGNNPEKRAQHTQVIIDEADRLTTLVNDILDLSKLEAGTVKINPEQFDLSKDVNEIVDRFKVFEDTKGFDFQVDVQEDIFVIADEKSLAQVIYNLISNAVNYTGDDKKVIITLKAVGENARFEVRDTGNGIAPEELDIVWQRYYRASESHKRTKIGTGVGLSIVKNILENHDADYGVESTVGEGSTFWFELKKI